MKVITFKDLYKLTGAPSYELTPYLVNEDSSTLGEILLNRNLISQAKSNIIELDPYINKLFLALCERHWDRSVVAECEDEDYEEEITSVLLRLINEIDFSYTYFSTLLRNYDSQAGEFIKQIMSTSSNQNWQNDTPQLVEGQSFIDESYTSFYTRNNVSTSVDSGTVMAKLKELEKDFMDVWSEWQVHFNKFVLY